MSNQRPSTDVTHDDLQCEFVREALQDILRDYCNADYHLETLFEGVMRYADVLETHGTVNGSSLPRSELERVAFEAFEAELMPQHPIPPVSKEDESFAKELAIVRDSSLQDLVKEIRVITKRLDEFRPADPSEMDLHVFLFWLRLLAVRATCLQGVGSYKAAILDCTSGLSAIDQCRVLKSMTHATKMILSAVLAFSKLKMGDNKKAPFVDAIESCDKLLAAEHSRAVIDLANATRASLTSERDDVESTLRLPLGLDRITRLYGHSPACMHTFSVLIRDLSLSHQYHQVASACERWVMSALLHQDLQLVGLSEKFAQAPGFPIAATLDGTDNPYVTFADPSIIVKSTNRKVLHHYLVALLMQNRWEEAGFVLKHAAGTGLHVESYWLVRRALEMRSNGNHVFESGNFIDASKEFKKSLEKLMIYYAVFLISRVLTDDDRRLLTATLKHKIGMCLVMQGKHEDALWKFRSCLADVPDFMEALEESALCHCKLKEWSQAKTYCRSYIDKYESQAPLSYPNVRGITFPNRVEESAYQRLKKLLALVDDQEQGALRTSTGPPLPASPPSRAEEELHEPNHPSPKRSRCNRRPVPNDETASALNCLGMNPSSELSLIEKYRDVSKKMELVAKYIQVCDAFEILHLDPATRSMSAIDEAVHGIGPENGSPEIDEAVKTAKTHVACKILELSSFTEIEMFNSSYLNQEDKLAFEFVCSITGADPKGSPLSASRP